jgi:indolepyruvate ferredoxin oxidoreductase
LDDKYTQEEGLILLSGIQALVRLPFDQHRADKRKNLNTATLISGYRGSPLAGLDMMLLHNRHLLEEHQVVFISGVNEELGATAVFGSQTANLLPNPKYDGVLGMWYGKAPGVDRTGDVFKHANFCRRGALWGVPLWRATIRLPNHRRSLRILRLHSMMRFPHPVSRKCARILDMGRLGFELSRYSGLWVGFKIVTNVADEFSTAEVSPERIVINDPGFMYGGKPWQHTQNTNLLTPFSLTMEREIYEGRLEAAVRFAAVNKLNVITVPTPGAGWDRGSGQNLLRFAAGIT